jgi:FO synthase
MICPAITETMFPAADALALADVRDTAALLRDAARLRDAQFGSVMTYSRKVFIPLTHLCRDSCHYCTFAQPPRRGRAAYMSPEDVLAVARAGARAGATEALFTLGDKPELRYAAARDALAGLGYATTLDYLAAMAALVLKETGLPPHLNPGVMRREDMARLRKVSASMGLMLETAADRLSEKGHVHFGSPDKVPAVRLATIATAGELAIPFTTGLLIGIGETRRERIDALLALRDLDAAYEHIQEVIIQPFRAKPGTRMAEYANASDDELLWTLAVARIVLPVTISLQTPPNLAPHLLDAAIDAGIDDWGGISPVTPDFVNPEAPWPEVAALAAKLATRGRTLVQRLPVYPRLLRGEALPSPPPGGRRSPRVSAAGDGDSGATGSTPNSLNGRHPTPDHLRWSNPPPPGEGVRAWLDPAIRTAVLRASDAEGFARSDVWSPGQSDVPATAIPRRPNSAASPSLEQILARAESGEGLGEADIVRLFAARSGDFDHLCAAADRLRAQAVGDTVTYVVNRNINYTNVCSYRCGFCAFSKGKSAEHLRGAAYDLDHDELARRVAEAWARGATEVCLQGGIHPAYTGDTYLAILRTAKAAAPGIHVHAFSPLEVCHGASTLGIPVVRFLERLRDAGLGTLPGTAAEILDDDVRAVICPDKLTTSEWLATIETAHQVGLRTTSTIMFGHVEGPEHWARHLAELRNLQARTGGFTEFVPLPFVHMEAPLYFKGAARRGPTLREAILMHAVARLALHPLIIHIQTSWVKMGRDGAIACLQAGCNDLGGTLMNESISRAAGAAHGQELPPAEMEALAAAIGRLATQRTTLYTPASAERDAAARNAAHLMPVIQTPVKRHPVTSRRRGEVDARSGAGDRERAYHREAAAPDLSVRDR